VLVNDHARLLRYLGDWEEYEHRGVGCRFWRDTVVVEREAAARRLQLMFRQFWFVQGPIHWYSVAFTWKMPPAVKKFEEERTGWAVLRRRSRYLRDVTDVDDRVWKEHMDPVCGEIFYFLPRSGFSQWTKPKIPKLNTECVLEDMHLDDAVMFRFPGNQVSTPGYVVKVRKDPDNGERMYDVEPQGEEQKKKTPIMKWVKRKALNWLPKSHEEVEMEREERLWLMQLHRQQNARARARRRQEEKDAAEQLKKHRRRARRGRDDDIEVARAAMAAAEAATLAAEAQAKLERDHLAAIMATAQSQGIDVRAFKAQQEGTSLLRVEHDVDEENIHEFEDEMQKAREQMEYQREMREAEIAKKGKDDEERERWLSAREDGVTTPRTKARRRLLRLLYKATRRQNRGYVICEWGCGVWAQIGRDKLFHEKESCVKRIIPCVLGCELRRREEEWMVLEDADPEVEAGGPPPAHPRTMQQVHEQDECPKRLVPCDRRCGEWVAADALDHHMTVMCIKRPFPEIWCRLGCGVYFKGGAHEVLQLEAKRLEHEQEMCEERMVRCHFKKCAATCKAKDRRRHRRLHMLRGGIALYTVPGVYTYKVPGGARQLKVQIWGAGGGSGHLRDQVAGNGGGGAFVEALMVVVPDEALEIVVGAGGSAGVYGGTVQLVHEDDPAATEVEEVCGVSRGGHPGGGNGHGGNECWAAGGGGGYSMVQRFTKTGPVPVFVAGGGGGGGARDGCPGGGLDGELPGMRVDKRNGRMGTQDRGGAAGDSGEAALCTFPSKPGAQWQGGNGAQFGGGGGGGLFGGGGGGTSPGIAGGGGGGSSYVDVTACKDFVVLQGVGNFPGGTKHQPPKACGIGEWDYTGGFSGSGGGADIREVHPGKNGAVKILRPGFYFEDSSLLQALG